MASANMLEDVGRVDTTTKVISHNLHAKTMEDRQVRAKLCASIDEALETVAYNK